MNEIGHLFSENLRKLRAEANLTQFQLAELLGVDQSTVQKWEGGTRWPRSDQILSICRVFKARPWRLFAAPDDVPQPGPRAAIEILSGFVEHALNPRASGIHEASGWKTVEPFKFSRESRIPDHARELLEQISPENAEAWALISATAITVGKVKPPTAKPRS